MNLQKIQQYISDYKKHLQATRDFEEGYKWESLQVFQNNWDIEAADFGKMYDASFQNSETRRLWKGDNFFPKEMMLKFIETAPDFVRNMFRDLFDENKDVENRISRFQFCCDSLLSEYKSKFPLTIENRHFHLENHMISMYLCFRFPEQYSLFEYPAFKQAMINIGVTKVPTPFDITRFFKVARTLNTFLQKDQELVFLQKKKLRSPIHFKENTLLLVNDFYIFISRN
ncbi:MAG: hypothetical protein AB8F94_07480 [Saprospiraceae bacterium]